MIQQHNENTEVQWMTHRITFDLVLNRRDTSVVFLRLSVNPLHLELNQWISGASALPIYFACGYQSNAVPSPASTRVARIRASIMTQLVQRGLEFRTRSMHPIFAPSRMIRPYIHFILAPRSLLFRRRHPAKSRGLQIKTKFIVRVFLSVSSSDFNLDTSRCLLVCIFILLVV